MPPPSRTFTLPVASIGAFTFRRRTLGDEIAIEARWSEMLAGVANPSPLLDTLASAVATLRVLTVAAPPGWEPATLLDMDLLEDDRTDDLVRIYGALCAREDEFRPPAKRRFQAPRAGDGADAGGVVPPALPPAAD